MPEQLNFTMDTSSAIPARLLTQARADAASIGYAQGWAHGLTDAHRSKAADLAAARAEQRQHVAERTARLGSALSALAQGAAQLETMAVPTCEQIEDTILAVAVELAEALLGRELALPDAAGPAALARIMALAPAGEPVTVRLNPTDAATLDADGGAELRATISGTAGRALRLHADTDLQSGDAIARCGATTIDARLSAGLQRLRDYVSR